MRQVVVHDQAVVESREGPTQAVAYCHFSNCDLGGIMERITNGHVAVN